MASKMKKETKFKPTEIEDKLRELKVLPLEMECRLLNIVKFVEGDYKTLIKNYFSQFEEMVKNYKLLSEQARDLHEHSAEVLLNSAVEGLIKIILFVDDSISYLNIEKRKRTIGSLKSNILQLIKTKEKSQEKIKIIDYLLDIIQELRNNFIHFSFYSQKDYRFEYLYFQLIAYLIDSFNYWDKLSKATSEYIKKIAKDIPGGVDLLGGEKLYD